MGSMVVEVGPEIEQFILQICTRPEQHVIQIFASNGANEPFHERMRQGNVGDGLDFCHLQDAQIGLPLVELIERIMVGAEVLWQPALTSNGAAKHVIEPATPPLLTFPWILRKVGCYHAHHENHPSAAISCSSDDASPLCGSNDRQGPRTPTGAL